VLCAASCEVGGKEGRGLAKRALAFSLSGSAALLFSAPVAGGQQELAEENEAVQLEEGGWEQAQGRKDMFWHLLCPRAEETRGAPLLKTALWRLC